MMNSKTVMTACSIILGATGIMLTFAPDMALLYLKMEKDSASMLLVQVIGGLYFGYSMLNWMTKGNLMGGIYNRPIAIGNFTHFLVAGLAIVKSLRSNPELPKTLWVVGTIYMIFGLLFAAILFRHPISSTIDKQNEL
jgi:threonine/homoserine/homoserine lactone efflux protein